MTNVNNNNNNNNWIPAIFLLLLAAAVPITTMQVSYAQLGEQQEEGESDDDRGLIVTLNGETFTRGDPVTIRGTVSEKSSSSLFFVEIRDPDGIRIGTWSVPINDDLTFIHGFTAGYLVDMDKFGTYQISLRYRPSTTESGVETTDLSFEYVSGTSATGTETTAPPPPTTGAQPQGVEIILMQNGTGVIVDNSDPNLPQNRATFNWTQTGGSPIRFENSTIILER